MQVYVRLDNGSGSSFKINPILPISQIKRQIEQFLNESVNNYQVLFKNTKIEWNQIPEAKGIKQNSILHLCKKGTDLKQELAVDLFTISVKIFFSKQFYVIRVGSEDKVLQLKRNIQRLLKIHPKDQILVFRAKKLDDHRTLSQESVSNDSLITLICKKAPLIFSDSSQISHLTQTELADSVTSLNLVQKASQKSKTTLFRSDSIGSKNTENSTPAEVEVKFYKDVDIDLSASVESEVVIYNHSCSPMEPMFKNKAHQSQIQQFGGSLRIQTLKMKLQNNPIVLNEEDSEDFQDEDQSGETSGKEESICQKLNFLEEDLYNSVEFTESLGVQSLKDLKGGSIEKQQCSKPCLINPNFRIDTPNSPYSPYSPFCQDELLEKRHGNLVSFESRETTFFNWQK